jgi:endonuclease/exonuclease/phosphatase family metal-dependent hydrolase
MPTPHARPTGFTSILALASVVGLAAALGVGLSRQPESPSQPEGKPLTHPTPPDAPKVDAPRPLSPPPATPATPAPAPAPAPAEPVVHEVVDLVRFGIKAPKPRPDGTIRVMSWNAENLFDDKDDPTLSGRSEDMKSAKPKEELDAAAAVIRSVNPDVIALQEIESKEALTWFRDNWLKDAGYDFISSIDAGDERGIEQSVISRFPIVAEKNWVKAELGVAPAGSRDAGKPQVMHRSPLLVDIEVPAEKTGSGKPYRLTLMVVHQKSGRDFGWFRELESAKFAQIITGLLADPKEQNFILAGDFNATPADQSYKLYAPTGLIDLFADPTGKDPKFITHASGREIDHMLVAPTLKVECIPDSQFILGTPILPEGVDYRQAPSPPGYSSDHFPLVVDIKPVDAPPLPRK